MVGEIGVETGTSWDIPDPTIDPGRAYWAEDLVVGIGGETDGRTITETDVVNFAGLTGNYDPQYTDAEFAKKSVFGARIAPAMLAFSVGFRLWGQQRDLCYPLPRTVFAGHLNDTGRFLLPVKIGDTIRCHYRKAGSRDSKNKPENAIVTYEIQVINQRNEVVQDGSTIFIIPKRQR